MSNTGYKAINTIWMLIPVNSLAFRVLFFVRCCCFFSRDGGYKICWQMGSKIWFDRARGFACLKHPGHGSALPHSLHGSRAGMAGIGSESGLLGRKMSQIGIEGSKGKISVYLNDDLIRFSVMASFSEILKQFMNFNLLTINPVERRYNLRASL